MSTDRTAVEAHTSEDLDAILYEIDVVDRTSQIDVTEVPGTDHRVYGLESRSTGVAGLTDTSAVAAAESQVIDAARSGSAITLIYLRIVNFDL